MQLNTDHVVRYNVGGSFREIVNPLLPEHIKVGRIFWYGGSTSRGGWSCPAIITRINKRRTRFKVRSLDDMLEQDHWYKFDAASDESDCRRMMRLVDPDVVREYLGKRRPSLVLQLESAKSSLSMAEWHLNEFDRVRSTLTIA